MNKLVLIIYIICHLTNLSCSQEDDNKNLHKVEIKSDLSDDFFNTKTYSHNPSSIRVYRNDTLVIDTIPDIGIEKEVNAFIEDQYNKKFGLSECFGIALKDTMLIEFRNDLMEDYLLSVKVINGYFNSSFAESKLIENKWVPTKERLILNMDDFKKDQEVKGVIEIEFVLIDAGIKRDSVLFSGPFYYKAK